MTGIVTRIRRHYTRRHITAAPADLGFSYSREPDPDTSSPVPAGVDLYFFTGRTPRRAAA